MQNQHIDIWQLVEIKKKKSMRPIGMTAIGTKKGVPSLGGGEDPEKLEIFGKEWGLENVQKPLKNVS